MKKCPDSCGTKPARWEKRKHRKREAMFCSKCGRFIGYVVKQKT